MRTRSERPPRPTDLSQRSVYMVTFRRAMAANAWSAIRGIVSAGWSSTIFTQRREDIAGYSHLFAVNEDGSQICTVFRGRMSGMFNEGHETTCGWRSAVFCYQKVRRASLQSSKQRKLDCKIKVGKASNELRTYLQMP